MFKIICICSTNKNSKTSSPYELLQKRWRTSTDSSQCQLGGKPSTPRLASSALGYLATSFWLWGWNYTRCTFQTSFPPQCTLGSGELVCKVHLVQFQLKYTQVHVWVHLSLQAWIDVLKHELGYTWSWVGEVLPLLRITSSRVSQVSRCQACKARSTWQTSELTLRRCLKFYPFSTHQTVSTEVQPSSCSSSLLLACLDQLTKIVTHEPEAQSVNSPPPFSGKLHVETLS